MVITGNLAVDTILHGIGFVGETYNCKNCGFKCDRDMVGALGILLKAVR
jgi:transposase